MLDAFLEQAEMPAEIDEWAALVGKLELRLGDDDRRAVVALLDPGLSNNLVDGGGLVPRESGEIKPGLTVGADLDVIGHIGKGELCELGEHVLLRDREPRNGARRSCSFEAPALVHELVRNAAPPA